LSKLISILTGGFLKALVTGGRGFIGSFLVEKLLQSGYEVRCLLRNKGKGFGWLNGLDIEFYEGEITNPDSLTHAVQGVDYVFHLAGATKSNSKIEFYKINTEGTKNLLKATQEFNRKVKRFVFVSSLAAAGPGQAGKPVTESDPPKPVSHYGKSKLKAEQATRSFSKEIPITIIRPPSVYGPRDRDIFRYFKYTKQGWRLVLSGGPRYSSFIYVKDLVEGIVLGAETEQALGQTYYLSDDQLYSWDYFGDVLAQALEVKPRRILVPVPLAFWVSLGFDLFSKITGRSTLFNLDKYRELKQTHWTCDNSKARKELSFKPRYSLEQGIRETCEWYLKNGWLE
jgi:nucleoside-diphosphate-sugar epimerase